MVKMSSFFMEGVQRGAKGVHVCFFSPKTAKNGGYKKARIP
jgi:hypothetical protein